MSQFTLFIGPCVLESEELVYRVAEFLVKNINRKYNDLKVVFKGSFDKANRTSIHSYRGPGLEQGLTMLQNVKKDFKLPVVTDFHLPEQAESVAEVCDFLQIPAFLSRQTDMIVEGAKAAQKYNRSLKIKKGQFLSPMDCQNIVEKASSFIARDKIYLTERGSSFGYNNLIVDMASFSIMKSFGVQVIHDATHCVQRPGSMGGHSGGARESIFPLAKAAVAAGAQGIFMEIHPNPKEAKSDSATSLSFLEVEDLLPQVIEIYKVVS